MVHLGDKVKDKVSGFEGIAVARYSYLQGCDRISVQPEVDKDGKLPETETFDEPQLLITQQKVVVPGNDTTGGPEKYTPKERYKDNR